MQRALHSCVLTAVVTVFATGVEAAVIWNVDGAGRLTGASGVDVNGSRYTVTFLDGTCFAVFDGCDELTDLPFNDFPSAEAASLALLDQVFLNNALGAFDHEPERTFGCLNTALCQVVTPFFLDFTPGNIRVGTQVAYNGFANPPFTSGIPDEVRGYDGVITYTSTDFSEERMGSFGLIPDDRVWASWARESAVPPVPEPAAMILSAVGAAAIAVRRRRFD
jgi:hypothetical protein